MFNFAHGFHMHVIRARHLARHALGWRPGLVSSLHCRR
jgi:hypothetical protein